MNFDAVELPWLLPLAVVLPAVVVALVVLRARRRAARAARLGERALVARLAPALAAAGRGTAWRAARLGLAALLGALALSGPRWGARGDVVRTEGVDVVLALDASLSMLAADDRPSRLDRMRQTVRQLLAAAPGNRVALLAFAGRSYILTPLTTDDGAIGLFLDNLDPSVVGQAGSSMARAIRQATDLLQVSPSPGDRAIVLMSDGESFEPESDIADAAGEARKAGIVVNTVGFGTEAGATIPVKEENTVREKRDAEGNVVVTRYDPATLRAAAQAGGGTFVPAAAPDKAARVRAALAGLRATARATRTGRDFAPRFQWFVAPALALLLLDTWLARRPPRRRRAPADSAAGAAGATSPASAASAGAASAVAAALLVTAFGACALPWPGREDEALARYRRGDLAGALSEYRGRLRPAGGSALGRYNAGTTLVRAESLASATPLLDDARRSDDVEVRWRAIFDLGLVHLRRGLAPAGASLTGSSGAPASAPPGAPDSAGAGGRAELDAALALYRRAIRMRPNDVDAKWNYELALQRPPSSGGGGGDGGGGGAPNQSPPAPQPSHLGQQSAEEILQAASREERDTQGRQQRRTPPPPPGGKDW